MRRPPLGLIGVGLMGTALAERFRSARMGVLGCDVNPSRRRTLERLGGRWASDPEVVFDACRRVVLSLPEGETVNRVLSEFPPRRGTIVIDTSTGDPRRSAILGRRLARRGVKYLDATVSGSSRVVKAGNATVMAGGPPAAFRRCADIFGAFAKRAFLVGPCGAGSRMKLVHNLVLGLNRAALAEGLGFARRLGLGPDTVLKVLLEGAAYSKAMEAKGQKMVRRKFSPEARLSQHLKDVKLILIEGRRSRAELPLSRVHRQLLERVARKGHGDADNSAVILAFEH